MPELKKPFDGLAHDYDLARPRYPEMAFHQLLSELPARSLNVADAGAGTGIALEGLVPLLSEGSRIDAIDISADMVAVGRKKFPTVHWNIQSVEAWLASRTDLDIVLAAQSYQWMDRPTFVTNAGSALRPQGGVLAILQNNRNYNLPGLAAEYEDLLEAMSPGYRRDYRAIDVPSETAHIARKQAQYRFEWVDAMPASSFERMSRSSTQAQRAIDNRGDQFLNSVLELVHSHETSGEVQLNYVTELFITHVE